ncbi:methyltransferase domain-containing protein [Iamia sp. SCSIO 61187]|uniref:class I SAM-dependent methyltransferase n=1 Tax=Iamia sp. SCSIO 61187 TaxID=2722752 RepID=UPI001C625032|nr:methyltransferase domain-containing protein [Iamia sp. SCSIO 61187]QYG94254.1 methyltransferase domain-containing protein [Iamia sp. SCSIO 61187]
MPATAQAATNARRWLIAAFRSARNIATDLRHGQFTAAVPGRHGDTNNSDHKVLQAVFDQRVRPGDVIIDVGCGRGRVLAHLLRNHPGHRVVGIEIDHELAATTARRFADEALCEVIAGDAVAVLPDDATLLFLFNPFGEADIERLRVALEARPATQPPQRLLYSNPRHLGGFESSDAWTVRMNTLGGGRLVPFHDLAVIDRVV